MTIEKKLLGTSPSGDASNVAEVFSTHLYTGTGSSHAINNGIDLAGEGGLVWTKSRGAHNHSLHDSERGVTCLLRSNGTNAQYCDSTQISSFNSNGFTVGTDGSSNTSGRTYASWTFRNKEKFFKAVTFSYGGSSSSPTVVTHDLGCTVGMTIVKHTTGNHNWYVQHKDVTGNDNNGALNLTIAFTGGNGQSTSFTSITDTQATFGAAASFPAGTYVAYFFADNSSELADNQMIKCGSYSSVSGNQEINLGWEPQWILVKKTDGAEDWAIIDNMRGFSHTADDVSTTLNKALLANTSSVEENSGYAVVRPTSTGFIVRSGLDALYASSGSYIYMAIRGPMMKEPEAATDVFAMDLGTGSVPSFISGFPVDMAFNASYASAATHKIVGTRLTVGKYLDTTVNGAEANEGHNTFDFMNGWNKDSRSSAYLCWMWKRAKGYFDVAVYTGTGANHTVSHNLGAVPEMMWIKNRQRTRSWMVYHKDAGASKYFVLDTDAAAVTAGTTVFQQLTPTNTNFYVGSNGNANRYGDAMIAYLFATLDGISKVGTFVSGGSGVTVNVDCGFSNGARFVLIKALTTDSWYFWDTVRGIVAGNDSRLSLDNNNAVVTNQDNIDPYSAGFSLNGTLIGNSGNTFIFYAIA